MVGRSLTPTFWIFKMDVMYYWLIYWKYQLTLTIGMEFISQIINNLYFEMKLIDRKCDCWFFSGCVQRVHCFEHGHELDSPWVLKHLYFGSFRSNYDWISTVLKIQSQIETQFFWKHWEFKHVQNHSKFIEKILN